MGYNRVTGEKVAVKIITKNESQRGFNTKRIFQEVNVQKVCQHIMYLPIDVRFSRAELVGSQR
jgi:hypothetical protein